MRAVVRKVGRVEGTGVILVLPGVPGKGLGPCCGGLEFELAEQHKRLVACRWCPVTLTLNALNL
jgi:hypothetical protein